MEYLVWLYYEGKKSRMIIVDAVNLGARLFVQKLTLVRFGDSWVKNGALLALIFGEWFQLGTGGISYWAESVISVTMECQRLMLVALRDSGGRRRPGVMLSPGPPSFHVSRSENDETENRRSAARHLCVFCLLYFPHCAGYLQSDNQCRNSKSVFLNSFSWKVNQKNKLTVSLTKANTRVRK